MSNNQSPIPSIVDAKITTPVVAIIALLLGYDYFAERTYSSNPWLVLGTVAVLILFSLSHFIPALKYGENHALYIFLYYLFFTWLIVFIVPTLTPYTFLIIVPAYLADYYFKTSGFMLINIGFIISLFVSAASQDLLVEISDISQVIREFIIVTLITLCIIYGVRGVRNQRVQAIDRLTDTQALKDKYQAMLDTQEKPAVLIDELGGIHIYNNAFQKITKNKGDMRELRIDNRLKLESEDKLPVSLLKLLAKKHNKDGIDLTLVSDDNSRIPVNIKIKKSYIKDSNYGGKFYVLMLNEAIE
jgi:hypothetical protein